MKMPTSVELCGAPTLKGQGPPCENRAGMGTGHVGYGPCKKHGGRTQSVEKHWAAVMATDFAKEALALEEGIDPLQAKLLSVRLAAGLVGFWRKRWSEVGPTREVLDGFGMAIDKLDRFSKTALDADVNERLVHLAEREADPIVLAFEEALANQPEIKAAIRDRLVQDFERALEKTVADTVDGSARELPA
jgi:hypothetical protein